MCASVYIGSKLATIIYPAQQFQLVNFLNPDDTEYLKKHKNWSILQIKLDLNAHTRFHCVTPSALIVHEKNEYAHILSI